MEGRRRAQLLCHFAFGGVFGRLLHIRAVTNWRSRHADLGIADRVVRGRGEVAARYRSKNRHLGEDHKAWLPLIAARRLSVQPDLDDDGRTDVNGSLIVPFCNYENKLKVFILIPNPCPLIDRFIWRVCPLSSATARFSSVLHEIGHE